jgi:hypothetical protein
MTSAYDPNAFIGYRTRVSRNAVTERSEHYAANEMTCIGSAWRGPWELAREAWHLCLDRPGYLGASSAQTHLTRIASGALDIHGYGA